MTDLNDNYNDNTMLNDWWPIVKSNFAKVEEELNKSITSDRLADGVVTAGKIASSAVTEAKLASNAVTTAKLKDGAVTAEKLANISVTKTKLGTDVLKELDSKASKQTANGGFAGGQDASATHGAAIGQAANAATGGAVGYEATATKGFSGGYKAKSAVDAIQLGEGTNTKEKTLQVYDHTLLNADGKIPHERFPAYSKTPVRIGTWINGTPVWRKVVDFQVTDEDFAQGYHKITGNDVGLTDPEAIQILTGGVIRRCYENEDIIDSAPAEIGNSLMIELDGTSKHYRRIFGVIEFVAEAEYIA